MADSILKEVTFTPQVFDKNYNMLDIFNRLSKLKEILIGLRFSAVIVGLSKKRWQEEIDYFIDSYDDNYRDMLQSVLNDLIDKNKIVYCPKKSSHGTSEDEWINTAKGLNAFRKFDFVLATKKTDLTTTTETIDAEAYHNSGAIIDKQTSRFMEKMLAPILSYTEIVKIYDPYFSLTPETGDKKRFQNTLKIICENLGNHHGVKDKAIIEIHTSIKCMLNNARPKEFIWQKSDGWPKIIKDFENKYRHAIILNIWEEAKREDEWHDRWLITDQCGISMGKGSDISEWTDSTWGLLDWEELPKVSNKFIETRKIYN